MEYFDDDEVNAKMNVTIDEIKNNNNSSYYNNDMSLLFDSKKLIK